MDLTGRTAFVTGANRGLGAAFVDQLIDRGAAKVYAGARSPESVAQRNGVVPVEFDLQDEKTISQAAVQCDDVDLLILNAAITGLGPVIAPEAPEALREQFDVNVLGQHLTMVAFAPVLTARAAAERPAGLIVVNSVAGLVISRSSPLYSAGKAALMMLTQGARGELAPLNVRVTGSYPGFIDTDMGSRFPLRKASAAEVAQRTVDGWLAGESTVFPDDYATRLGDAMVTRQTEILADPQAVATDLITQWAKDFPV